MEPFVERMVYEQQDLAEKLTKLRNFINNTTTYAKLDEVKQGLLVIQLEAMQTYYNTLGLRLALEDK